MIRKSCEIYEEFREPRNLRLRRSSWNERMEREYIKIYNIEEHMLYRKQELSSIWQNYYYYKYLDEIIHYLSAKCRVYTKYSVYEMLGCYLIGESNTEKMGDSKKIMEYRLNLKDKNLTLGEIYVCHCMNLPDCYSFLMLTNI